MLTVSAQFLEHCAIHWTILSTRVPGTYPHSSSSSLRVNIVTSIVGKAYVVSQIPVPVINRLQYSPKQPWWNLAYATSLHVSPAFCCDPGCNRQGAAAWKARMSLWTLAWPQFLLVSKQAYIAAATSIPCIFEAPHANSLRLDCREVSGWIKVVRCWSPSRAENWLSTEWAFESPRHLTQPQKSRFKFPFVYSKSARTNMSALKRPNDLPLWWFFPGLTLWLAVVVVAVCGCGGGGGNGGVLAAAATAVVVSTLSCHFYPTTSTVPPSVCPDSTSWRYKKQQYWINQGWQTKLSANTRSLRAQQTRHPRNKN